MPDRYVRLNIFTRGTARAKQELGSVRNDADELERPRNVPIGVDDAKGQLALKDLKTKLDLLGKKRVAATADVKDSAGKAKLLDMKLKLERLNTYVASPRITLAGADRTMARILAIDAAMDKLSGKSARISIGTHRSLFSRFGGLFGEGSKIGRAISGISAAGAGIGSVASQGLSNPYVAATAAAAAIAALPFAALAAAGGIVTVLGGAMGAVGLIFAAKNKGIQRDWHGLTKQMGADMKSISAPFVTVLHQVISQARSTVPVLFSALGQAFKAFAGPLGGVLKTIVKTLGDPQVTSAIKVMGQAFGSVLKALKPAIPDIVRNLAKGLQSVAQAIKAHPQLFVDFIKFLSAVVLRGLQAAGALARVANWIVGAFRTAYNWLKNNFFAKMKTLFTVDIPAMFQIFKGKVQLIWLFLKSSALRTVFDIVSAFAKLPGPMGAPFKKARNAIGAELDRIATKAAQTQVKVNAAFDRMHGKTVHLDIFGKGKWAAHTRTEIAQGGVPLGGGSARGRLVNVGTGPTADDVVARVSRGELIVPARMVSAGAVDHLRGSIPGFAQGGIVPRYKGSVGGMLPWARHNTAVTERMMTSSIASVFASAWQRLLRSAMSSFSGFGISPRGPIQRYARKLLRAYGWGIQWPAFNSLVMAESRWRWNATNRGSGAYGIPQALPAGKMASAGADWRTNPFTQLRWMMGYIKSAYGNPNNAWAHELGFRWYGKGFHGWFDRPTLIGVGDRGRERVDITPGGGSHGGTVMHNHFTINAGPLAHPADIGREVVTVIKEFEKRSGTSWRK